jgi:hypothetical protein
MVAQSLTRPYPVSLPMVVLVLLIPFYIFIAEMMPGRKLNVPELAWDRALRLQPAWALVYGALSVARIDVVEAPARQRRMPRALAPTARAVTDFAPPASSSRRVRGGGPFIDPDSAQRRCQRERREGGRAGGSKTPQWSGGLQPAEGRRAPPIGGLKPAAPLARGAHLVSHSGDERRPPQRA